VVSKRALGTIDRYGRLGSLSSPIRCHTSHGTPVGIVAGLAPPSAVRCVRVFPRPERLPAAVRNRSMVSSTVGDVVGGFLRSRRTASSPRPGPAPWPPVQWGSAGFRLSSYSTRVFGPRARRTAHARPWRPSGPHGSRDDGRLPPGPLPPIVAPRLRGGSQVSG
jgi:hypothetical protein